MPDSSSEIANRWRAALVCVVALAAASASAQTAEELATQRADYDRVASKSIVELQPFRRSESVVDPATGLPVELVSLNPNVNAWFLLTIGSGRSARTYHLENPDPGGQALTLGGIAAPELVITGRTETVRCAPWAGDPSEFATARARELPFGPICEDRLYFRNRVSGSRTSLEKTTDFLRDRVWGGEGVVRFVREKFFRDAEFQSGEEVGSVLDGPSPGPPPAIVDAPGGERPVIGTIHDFGLVGTDGNRMAEGAWYRVSELPGVYVSAIQPRAISREILSGPGRTNPLDSVERKATDFFVAFDLSRFDLGFAIGTDHPRLDWSPRPPASVRVPGLPGPDGVRSPDPIVTLGMVSPALTPRTIATFTGGFKRQHGAFKWGPFSTVNFGSHYGFIEQGTILSKLQPGLSTILVMNDGTIEMRTWRADDEPLLPLIRFARQNGVPLLETDQTTGLGVPGELVTAWGPGNWSGSAQAELRTLRAGGCIVDAGETRYLIYGYFSTATPSAMARTFQAYGCRYAMLLDMNALEHTYLALYIRRPDEVHVEHIVPGMGLVDRKDRQGQLIPRFLGYPDNRDVFYLTLKEDLE